MDGNPKRSVLDRIMSKVVIQDDGCWIWTGAKSGGDGRDKYKYGYINLCGKLGRVHRVLYEIKEKKIPEGMILLHKCDRPLCVNPDHMIVGTYKDNMDDAETKGRMWHPRGESNHSKLTEEQVIDIKKDISSTYKSLSDSYGVHPQTIKNIKDGKKWKHINYV